MEAKKNRYQKSSIVEWQLHRFPSRNEQKKHTKLGNFQISISFHNRASSSPETQNMSWQRLRLRKREERRGWLGGWQSKKLNRIVDFPPPLFTRWKYSELWNFIVSHNLWILSLSSNKWKMRRKRGEGERGRRRRAEFKAIDTHTIQAELNLNRHSFSSKRKHIIKIVPLNCESWLLVFIDFHPSQQWHEIWEMYERAKAALLALKSAP